MQPEIEQFIAAREQGDKEGAKAIAEAYFASRADLKARFDTADNSALVFIVDRYRERGRTEDQTVVQMYLRAFRKPQPIEGHVRVNAGKKG